MWLLPLSVMLVWFCAIPGEGFLVPTCPHQFYFRLPFRLTVFVVFIVPLIATLSIYLRILVSLFQAKARCRGVNLRCILIHCHWCNTGYLPANPPSGHWTKGTLAEKNVFVT
jgi:hypothetical protein